jgi:hypothetical protein
MANDWMNPRPVRSNRVLARSLTIGAGITISQENHEKLTQHICSRMEFATSQRDFLWNRMQSIDRELSGYLELDRQDKKRAADNAQGKGLKPTDVKLPLVESQIEEVVTYLMAIFAPETGIFSAVARPEEQAVAHAFSQLMNKNAQRMGYRTEYARAFKKMLKYNIGGFLTEWVTINGNSVVTSQTGQGVEVQNGEVWAGNKIRALDMYNTFLDPSVHPVDVPMYGEFFAIVEPHTKFRVARMKAAGELFNAERLQCDGNAKYWRAPPVVRAHDAEGRGGNMVNWFNFMSAAPASSGAAYDLGMEFVHYFGWINPKEFGLPVKAQNAKGRDTLEIWQFTMANADTIVWAQRLENAHGMLPVAIGVPNNDDLMLQEKSFAEMLIPLQTFASFLVNIHQRSARKRLYGITLYDKDLVDLNQIDTDEVMRVPVQAPAGGKDISKSIAHFTEAPETNNTLNEIDGILALMQRIIPSNIQNQVANLERATQYQAAAVVQGSNRKNQKLANIIDDQCMKTMRLQLLLNIFQYQQDMEIMNEQGQVTQIDPRAFRDSNLEFSIGDGLKGIDKLLVVESLRELLNVMLQSPQAWQQMDMIALINYWTTMIGDKADISQFRYKSPLDALPPEQKQIALQLFQQFMAQQQGGQNAQPVGAQPTAA